MSADTIGRTRWATHRVPRQAAIGLMALSLFLAGCVSNGGGGQFETSIYDTHKRVQKLEQDVDSSIRELNETTAALVARVDANDEQLRRLRTLCEENQAKLDALSKHLAGLRQTLSRAVGIGTSASARPYPSALGGDG